MTTEPNKAADWPTRSEAASLINCRTDCIHRSHNEESHFFNAQCTYLILMSTSRISTNDFGRQIAGLN